MVLGGGGARTKKWIGLRQHQWRYRICVSEAVVSHDARTQGWVAVWSQTEEGEGVGCEWWDFLFHFTVKKKKKKKAMIGNWEYCMKLANLWKESEFSVV